MDRGKLIKDLMTLEQRITHAVRRYHPEVWMGVDLTLSQLKSLMFIDYEGRTNSKKLATALGVTPPNVTGIIDRLAEQGFVSREENREDRRMINLTVTNQGKSILTKLREIRIHHISAVLVRLSTEELSALLRGLTALTRELEADQDKPIIEHNKR